MNRDIATVNVSVKMIPEQKLPYQVRVWIEVHEDGFAERVKNVVTGKTIILQPAMWLYRLLTNRRFAIALLQDPGIPGIYMNLNREYKKWDMGALLTESGEIFETNSEMSSRAFVEEIRIFLEKELAVLYREYLKLKEKAANFSM